MVVALAVNLGLIAVLFVVAFVVERRLGEAEPLLSVPAVVRALVGGLGLMLPHLLYWEGILTPSLPVVDDLVVVLALSFAGWILADRTVGVVRSGGAC